jgi:hypothetical protein
VAVSTKQLACAALFVPEGGLLMVRVFCWSFVALIVLGFVASRPAAAISISSRNPYRSFNISGINYGSMQWEKSHRQSNYSHRRSGGTVFRRR